MCNMKTLQEVCNALKVSRRAVQGYEEAGLVKASDKNKYGYLLYDEEAQKRIERIRLYQQLGFRRKEIKDLDYNEMVEAQRLNIVVSEGSEVDASGTELHNKNNIRIILKGIMQEDNDYSKDIHMYFLVENNYSEMISVEDVYDSLSVNGFMCDGIVIGRKIAAGEYGMIDIEISETTLEENNIQTVEDVTQTEITFEIKNDDYDTIDEAKLSINY